MADWISSADGLVGDPLGHHQWFDEPNVRMMTEPSTERVTLAVQMSEDLSVADVKVILSVAYTVLSAFEYDILERLLLDGRQPIQIASEFRLDGPQSAREWLLAIFDRLEGHLRAQGDMRRAETNPVVKR